LNATKNDIVRSLFIIEDSVANKISYYHVLLLLLSLPFDMFYSHVILISLILHTLIHLKKENIRPVFTLHNLLLSSVFFLTLLGTVYSANRPEAFKEVGMQIAILLTPLVFCINPLDLRKYRNNFLLAYSLGCVLVVFYLYLYALVVIFYYHLSLYTLFTPSFINHNFSNPIGMHATYLAMQVAAGLVFLLCMLIRDRRINYRIFYLVCCVVLTAGIIQLGSRAVFIALFLIINLGVPFFLLNYTRRVKFALLIIPLSLIIVGGIYGINNFKHRYVTELEKDLSKETASEVTDTRLARWNLALGIAAKSPLIGYGSGSEKALLKEGYFRNKFFHSYMSDLNAHNQFISILIKFGLLGLLVFLATLYYGFKISVKENDLILFAFLFVIATVCFSENIIDRDKGIYFYSIFFSLLIYSDLGTNNTKPAL